MYNRYIRNDNGTYTRFPQEEGHPQEAGRPRPDGRPSQEPPPASPHQAPRSTPPPGRSGFREPPPGDTPPGRLTDGLTGLLRHLLDQLHLDHVDTGDLLLLLLLFFLSREEADEELLIALGLLLIL
jgi:hypothetical protein